MDNTRSPRVTPQSYAKLKAMQRQLRRGTRSCWECKRRKTKCIFESGTRTTACYGCRRRGTPCISQEFEEDSAIDTEIVAKILGHDAAGRAETLSTHINNISSASTPLSDEPRTLPASMPSAPLRQQAFHRSESLSRVLHASLPSRDETIRIWNAVPQRPVLAHEMMTMPYTCLSQNDHTEYGNLLEIPDRDTHPVLIARHMLLLASLLLHLPRQMHADIRDPPENPRAMSERLANIAISYVTIKDDLLGSIEGLDCIMIESVYQANLGNLRRSWLACRRAVSVAQLMGLSRSNHRTQYEVLDPRVKYDTTIIWSRILFMDRFLCLLLGLPQGCPENSTSVGSEASLGTAGLLPMERLERVHCLVASQILERNEGELSADSFDITRTLDLELQKAARSVPSKWWLTPKPHGAGTEPYALFSSTGQVFAQVLHYNLLNQLHLPYMLRSATANPKYEYSRMTCVTASREVLTRFIALRTFNNIASSCRIVDFLALMAAITLLLAHLDSYNVGPENLLAHQYPTDRAMIEQVQEKFREVNNLNSDALSSRSADLLRRLLAIEVDSNTHGFAQSGGRVSVNKEENESAERTGPSHEGAVSVHIPYFGVIRISREGLSTVRSGSQPPPLNSARRSRHPQGADTSMFNQDRPIGHAESQSQSTNLDGPQGASHAQSMVMADPFSGHVGGAPGMVPEIDPTLHGRAVPVATSGGGSEYAGTLFAQPHLDELADPLLRSGEYPGLAAGVEDWAFQGIDFALFDSLMRGLGNGGNGGNGVGDLTMAGEWSSVS